MAGMAPRPIYRLDADAAAVARLKARIGLDLRELPGDPGAAEQLTAEVFGNNRADDLAHWRATAARSVAIERGGKLVGFAYRRGSGSARRPPRRRGKRDDACPGRLRFPARGPGDLRLSHRQPHAVQPGLRPAKHRPLISPAHRITLGPPQPRGSWGGPDPGTR